MVSAKAVGYIPERGDIVWLEFDPQAGHEQAGRRPALVISPQIYNGTRGLALICPITSKIKGYPFEVPLPDKQIVAGVIMSDQIKSLDWQSRKAKFVEKVSPNIMAEVMAKIRALLSD